MERLSAITALLLLLVVHGATLSAAVATFRVGGDDGWTIEQAQNWAKGKSFKGGDYLEFTYNYEWTNVIVANKTEYEACRFPFVGTYQTGHDFVPLHRGHNYFFSGMGGQCQLGFKMVVFAA